MPNIFAPAGTKRKTALAHRGMRDKLFKQKDLSQLESYLNAVIEQECRWGHTLTSEIFSIDPDSKDSFNEEELISKLSEVKKELNTLGYKMSISKSTIVKDSDPPKGNYILISIDWSSNEDKENK